MFIACHLHVYAGVIAQFVFYTSVDDFGLLIVFSNSFDHHAKHAVVFMNSRYVSCSDSHGHHLFSLLMFQSLLK